MTTPASMSADRLLHERDFSLVLGGPIFQPLRRSHGRLAERYVREFDAKWLLGGAPADERLVGSGDIQSLADLSNSFDVVRTMRIAPFTKETIIQLAVAAVLPLAPLLLTIMPLEALLKKLLGVLF